MQPASKTNLTASQQRAVAARGNVLVMAGAGTGKTHTLVERCLDLIGHEQVSLDEILIVTFTEAAATEMRERLREGMEKAARQQPSATHLAEQLALFDASHIGTLHSFCFKLVREHFHELGLDARLAVLDEAQARLLADEILEEQFHAHYENEDGFSLAVQDLIRIYGSGRDENIRSLVLRLHHYIQTRADAQSWLTQQIEGFSSADPVQWRKWFREAVAGWRNDWLPVLRNLRHENSKAAECLEIFEKFPEAASGSGDSCASLFEKIAAADVIYPNRKKGVLRKPLEDCFDDAEFLGSLAATGADPLKEDWEWIRGPMKTLLLLAKEFSENFSARKRTDGVLDFHDLEQFAIQLLWDFGSAGPAAIAAQWRGKLRFIFVDEYQDINAAQDRIIAALGGANRFLVGDVKQSIYRFRLADPKIFQEYAKNPADWNGQNIPLGENFRSRESLLDFVNSLFEPLMRADVGGVHYDDEAKLKFGSRETRAGLSVAKNPGPHVELLLRAKSRGDNSGAEAGDDALADLQDSEKEARMLALRLLELKNSGHQIWDDGKFRAAEWRDFAVLLRSPGAKAEIYAKQFERAGVPLLVERGGFYDSSEISDLLSLLTLADNPLQDVPCIAVLRSPLVGCSLDELAEIRLAGQGHFWFALNQAATSKAVGDATREKATRFLERFSRWRKLAQQASLSQCLELILAETHYDDWLLSRPRGAQRRANVQRFLTLAEQFDAFQRQGLFRFLKFVAAQREIEAEPEVTPMAGENAVRLMSIHQSKGLEFPVVALADLGKSFNEQDLRGEIILDERFGLCPRVKPPSSGGRYPSLAYWLAQKNQRRELRGEELRLLYVALTRARDTLVLSGSASEKRWDAFFENNNAVGPRDILAANSFLDWLGLWFKVRGSRFTIEAGAQGELPLLRWRVVNDFELVEPAGTSNQLENPLDISWNDTMAKRLADIVDWKYPHDKATKLAAKTSVTVLRREADELNDEAEQKFPRRFTGVSGRSEISPKPSRDEALNREPAGEPSKNDLPSIAVPSPLPFDGRGEGQGEVRVTRSPLVTRHPSLPEDEGGLYRASPAILSGVHGKKTNRNKAALMNAADTGVAHHKFLQHFSFEHAADVKWFKAEATRLEKENYLSADEAAALDLDALASFWGSEFGKKIRANAALVRRELAFTAGFKPGELDTIFEKEPETDLDSEVIVVQGVADLAVLLPQEIWLLDFKTDDVREKDLPEKIKFYSPQLKLYARALEKIYSRPVTDCRLHFLSARRTVSVPLPTSV